MYMTHAHKKKHVNISFKGLTPGEMRAELGAVSVLDLKSTDHSSKINDGYVCVRACVRACMRVCVCVCECVCVCV